MHLFIGGLAGMFGVLGFEQYLEPIYIDAGASPNVVTYLGYWPSGIIPFVIAVWLMMKITGFDKAKARGNIDGNSGYS